MPRLRSHLPILALAAIAFVAGCGGGGGATPSVSPTATPTPHAGPTTIPVGPSQQIVTLTGAGYILQFAMPAVDVGSTSSMNVALLATPPPGVFAPQSKRRNSAGMVAVPKIRETVGGNPTSLVYVTVTSSATVGFSNEPAFTFTLPAGTTIPSGASTYLLFFDPYQSSTGWIAAPLPATVSGQTVTFPSAKSGVSFQANTEYVYALAYTTSPIPTASPAPAPTATPTNAPTSAPSATPAPGATPGLCPAGPANTFPMSIRNNTAVSGTITVTAWGEDPSNLSTWDYITGPAGGVATAPASGNAVPSWALPANGCIDLPPLVSAHVLLMLGGNSFSIYSNGPTSGIAQPNPWVVNQGNAGEINTVWDFLEYTWTNTTSAFNLDVTQVDQLGIPISFNTVNSSGSPVPTQPFGMKPYATSNIVNDFNELGKPWTGLIQTTSVAGAPRIFSPQHAANIPADGAPTPSPAPSPNSPVFSVTNFWDPVVNKIWQTYTGSTFLHLSYAQFGNAYGVVDSHQNFNFYATKSTGGTLLATIPYPTTWDVFNNAGAFTTSASGPYGIFIGRALVVEIERGTLPVPSPLPANWPAYAQPFCGLSDSQFFFGGTTTHGGALPTQGLVVNWYAAEMHKYGEAPTGSGLPGVGLAYGFPDDDECQGPINGLYDPDASATFSAGQQWNVTLNPF